MASPQQPAGWYPDPTRPGSVRWWDGTQWSEHAAPASPPGVYGRETEGLAVASIITAVMGIPIAPIVLGHMARSKIEESGGAKDGAGLALAGIIIGWVEVAVFVLLFVALVAVGVGASA